MVCWVEWMTGWLVCWVEWMTGWLVCWVEWMTGWLVCWVASTDLLTGLLTMHQIRSSHQPQSLLCLCTTCPAKNRGCNDIDCKTLHVASGRTHTTRKTLVQCCINQLSEQTNARPSHAPMAVTSEPIFPHNSHARSINNSNAHTHILVQTHVYANTITRGNRGRFH